MSNDNVLYWLSLVLWRGALKNIVFILYRVCLAGVVGIILIAANAMLFR